MIFEVLFLAIAIAGFGYSAYLDLKYTEFPDWLPYSILIAAIVSRAAYYISIAGFTAKAINLMIPMAVTGILFLGFGLLFYYAKQWGDGDAWLLGGMGFLFPDSAGFAASSEALSFPIVLIFNFFIVSLIYMVAYSIALGIRNKEINREFIKSLKKDKIKTEALIAVFFALSIALSFFMQYYRGVSPSLSMYIFPFFLSAMVIFFHYGKAVEKKSFRKHIDVKELREGDVIMDGKWIGVTDEDIKKLQKKGGSVWIKEGVRFAPVFILTILVTLFIGNLMMLLVF